VLSKTCRLREVERQTRCLSCNLATLKGVHGAVHQACHTISRHAFPWPSRFRIQNLQKLSSNCDKISAGTVAPPTSPPSQRSPHFRMNLYLHIANIYYVAFALNRVYVAMQKHQRSNHLWPWYRLSRRQWKVLFLKLS